MRKISRTALYFLQLLWLAFSEERASSTTKSNVIFSCHDDHRGLSLQGKAYAQLADSLRDELERLGWTCQTIAHVGCIMTGRKGYGNPISVNKQYLLSLVKNKLFRSSEPVKHIYIDILRRSGAKLVISLDGPTDLARAARDCGIFHVELLHGMGYREVRWGWDKTETHALPQGILSLDYISTNTFSSLRHKGVLTKTIPNPLLRRFTTSRMTQIPLEWQLPLNTNNYTKRILVSLQWGYSGDHREHVEFASLLPNGLFYDELEALVANNPSIFWYFRLHPVQLRARQYSKARKFLRDFVKRYPNSDWEYASTLPFPAIAKACSGHITMSSMSCYDAASMGLPTIFLCPTLLKGSLYETWFSDLVEDGYAIKGRPDPLKLQQWLDSTSTMKPRDLNLSNYQLWDDALLWLSKQSGLDINTPPD